MKKHLLKTLLVGVMALAATSAWAQTVTTYDFEDGNALFTEDSRITASVVEGTQTIYEQAFALDGKAVSFKGANNAQNGYCFAHYDFSSLCDQAAKVKVEFETVLGNGARSIISVGDASVRGNTGNSSKTTYSNKGAIFRVGTDKSYSYVNGSNVGSSTVVSQKWLKVTIEVDEIAKKYTYSIVNKATEEVLFSNGEEPVAFYSSDATNCTQIDMFGYINNSQMGLIDNLIITVTKDEREQANYTVNFLDSSNNPIKEAVTRSGAVGDGITLLPADLEPLWNAEHTQKYIYQSDDSEGKTIAAAGTTVVNIIYRDAATYSYTVLSTLGATLATGSGFEGESLRVGYPRYQLDGTDLYMASVDNKEYRTTVNMTEDNVSKTVTYTQQEGKVVAFYTEAEDIAGITVATNDNIPVRASNALAATTTEDVTITTLAPGKYILHAGIFTSKSSYSDLTVNFGVGEETFAANFGAVNLNEVASEEYTLAAPTAISYLASSSENAQFDYIWIEKTGEVDNVTYTVAGNIEAIFGTKWAADAAVNDMEKGDDGIWTKTYENIDLEAGTIIYYKVVKNHSWDNESYGFDGDNADYMIKTTGTYETITFTFDPAAEGNKVSCVVKMADSELMAEARALAEEDGVAVGKLLKAIADAEAGDETGLQDAIDQYNLDNADQEKDETAKVGTGVGSWSVGSGNGSNRGTYSQGGITLVEHYGESAIGNMIWQDVNVDNGLYNVEVYATSHNAWNNFGANLQEDANDVAYVFGTSGENTVQTWITARRNSGMLDIEPETYAINGVNVTDGKLTIGLALAKADQTEWHTIQIKSLKWITTAKEVYAADQAELTALLEEAYALLANEYNTNGKEDFEAALVIPNEAATEKKNWYNITEIEEIITNLKAAIATFKQANWYINFTAGEYYIIDVKSDLKMAAGHDWGTRGIVNEAGLDLTLTPYSESRTVTIDSRVYNGDTSHFLGENLYMDSSEWGWALEYQGFGFYILEPNGGKYINLDKDNNLVLSDTPREFIIVTKDGVMAQRMAELEIATKDAPVDATFLIKANNFNRNDARNAEAWIVSEDCTNKKLSGGNNVNNCAESYHSTFTIMQTISDAPAGLYKMTAQGYFRQDDGQTEDAPDFFIGNKTAKLGAMANGEDNMTDASNSFTSGKYTIEPIEFKIYADGEITLGIKGTATHQWVIWDNFQLTYYGPAESEFYVAGVYNSTEENKEDIIFGSYWEPALNKMTAQEDGTYTFVKEKVDLTANSTIYYKVVADGDWDYAWGFEKDGKVVDADYIVGVDDNYDVVFTFNPTEKLENGYNLTCTLIEGGTTGISSIAAEAAENGNVYNLNGQKVKNLKKGLYIINGKKQVVK